MMTDATAPEMLAIAAPALLFLYLVWRREWEWIGLYVALSFAISAWIKCHVLLANLWDPSAPHTASLSWAIVGTVLYFGGMLGALRGPSGLRTLFVALAAMETLFVGVVPIYRFVFALDQEMYFAIDGEAVPDTIGFACTVVFGVLPMMIGIPWLLARQSASKKTIIASALSRYGMLSGIGVVAFMVFATSFVAWGYVGYGPFAGIPQSAAFPIERSLVGPNLVFGMLIGSVIYLFWSFPQRFFDPVVRLLEASQDVNCGPLQDVAHPLWRGLAQNLDERRREAAESQQALNQMRKLLLSFFDTAPVDMFVKTVEGQLVYCSPGLATVLGRARDEMVGMFESEYHDPRHLAQVRKIDAKLVRDGKPLVGEVFNPILKRHELQTRFPIFNDAGEVTHIGGMFIDIDERVKARQEQRKAQTALAEQQANLLAFFDYAPLQVYVTDLDHKIVMVNDWVHRETGADVFLPKNVIGLNADQMVPSSWADLSHDNDTTVVGKRDVTQVEVRGRFGGKERDIISIRFPIKDAEGEVVRIGGFVVDVTKQKEAERALKEQLAQSHQSEKLAALGQLLAGVAHELNNPLTVVVGRSAILQEKLVGTPHEKAIASLREAADRCNRIVKTFLAMARQSAPRRGRVQANDVIEAALDMTIYAIRSAGIELDCRLEPGLPEVEADEDQLVQVITNLLINAQHALDAHNGARAIVITTRPVEGRVTIAIADSGPGVPEELETRIFEPFFTTKEVGQGTGMGLAMSRGMIEEHGGTLTYRAVPGGGACFEVSLPLADAAESEPVADPEAETPIASRGRVLIVDDEASIREMLGEILDAAGLDFVEAADGAEALECLAGARFDLIFSDVRMPGMDGIGLRRELATSRPELIERLIFMSGDVLQRDRARHAEIAEHLFVEKPFNPAEVRRIALEILGQPGEPR